VSKSLRVHLTDEEVARRVAAVEEVVLVGGQRIALFRNLLECVQLELVFEFLPLDLQ
jgi:hypothetical protein